MPPNPADIDRILEAIRAEAKARGSRGTVGRHSAEGSSSPATVVAVATHGLAATQPRHVGDFLSLPLDVFIAQAYGHVLGREADAGGAAHYQRALLRGQLTRIEVLGRLQYSAEGRTGGRRLPGLAPAFALATLYRVPVLGPLAALAAHLLRMPSHWRDRSSIEAAALAAGTWMKR